MSDNQTVWTYLCRHAATGRPPGRPFEIGDVTAVIAQALGVPENRATALVGFLLNELARLPEGRQYFRREGNAVVPLPEFAGVPQDAKGILDAYPFEL
jgi:hypothetical protein